MSEEVCFFCKNEKATKQITDATQYPELYNGKWIGENCNTVREYMKEMT